jgi:hypothetical protein
MSADEAHSKCDAEYCGVRKNGDINYKSDKHIWKGEEQPWPVDAECNAKLVELVTERMSKPTLKGLILGEKTKGTQALECFHDYKARMLNKTISRNAYDFCGISNGALVCYNDGYEVLMRFTMSRFGIEFAKEEKHLLAVLRERQVANRKLQSSTKQKMKRKRKRVKLRKKESAADATEPVLYAGHGEHLEVIESSSE